MLGDNVSPLAMPIVRTVVHNPPWLSTARAELSTSDTGAVTARQANGRSPVIRESESTVV